MLLCIMLGHVSDVAMLRIMNTNYESVWMIHKVQSTILINNKDN